MSSNSTTSSSLAKLSIPEKLGHIRIPWETQAPGSEFAGMTPAEFEERTRPSLVSRETLAALKTEVKTAIAERKIADVATKLLIKRVVAGVVGHASHGPDSALYRAMGFVRSSERRIGLPGNPTRPARRTPALMDRLDPILLAWREIAPDDLFSGMSLAEVTAAAAPSISARSGGGQLQG